MNAVSLLVNQVVNESEAEFALLGAPGLGIMPALLSEVEVAPQVELDEFIVTGRVLRQSRGIRELASPLSE